MHTDKEELASTKALTQTLSRSEAIANPCLSMFIRGKLSLIADFQG
jgi:hypothetical protein